MRFAWIFLIVIFLVLGGVLGYLYFTKEKPIQETMETRVNLTIAASENNRYIKTGYRIEAVGIPFSKSGETNTLGSVLETLPFNYTYNIYNVNIENQNFYTSKQIISVKENKIYRVELKPQRPGSIEVYRKGRFNGVDNLSLIVESKGYYQNVLFCVKWSLNVIKIDFLSKYNEIPKPESHKKYFNCYTTGVSLNNEMMEIPISYRYWEVLTKDDFIHLVVMDSDLINNNYVSEVYNTDVGGKNMEYIFKI